MKSKPSALATLLETARQAIPDPSKGLPDEVFNFLLKVTPMINVDLLVRNERGEHLLAWREDEYATGWHIPGGIIRFNEPMEDRIAAVARIELSAEVEHTPHHVELRQYFHQRGHFISLLYLCALKRPVSNEGLWHTSGEPRHGQLAWKKGVPADVYPLHEMYSDWLKGRSN